MFSRKMLTFGISVIGVVFAVSICIGLSGSIAMADYGCPENDHLFTTDFRLDKCRFVSWGNNPYLKLWPGYQLDLESAEERVVVTVLWDTEMIDLRAEGIGRVRTRVVEEREFEDDMQIEVSRNFFARCRQTNSVYYFGEDVADCDLEEREGFWVNEDGSFDDTRCADGDPPDEEGAWRAGENGAMPGLIMPGTFLLDSKYFQEIAELDEAVDRGQNTAMGLTEPNPKGGPAFTGCVEVVDTNPAEGVCDVDDGDVKIYCPGVGLVMDEDLVLVDYGFYIVD